MKRREGERTRAREKERGGEVERGYLLVGVLVSLQGLHDGELSVVLEARRLVPQDLLQDTQRQRADGVLHGGARDHGLHRDGEGEYVSDDYLLELNVQDRGHTGL